MIIKDIGGLLFQFTETVTAARPQSAIILPNLAPIALFAIGKSH